MLISPTLQQLVTEWKREALTLRQRYADDVRATLIETLAAELKEVLHAGGNEVVNLTRAAELTGYKADTLGKMIRQGKLENVGRKNAPLVRVADLPRRASAAKQDTPVLHLDRATLYRDAARAVVANS